MERYGRAGEEEEEESRSDPSLEWTAPGNETGVEASMRRLGLQGGGGGIESYPERSDEPDCIYYLRTGVCGYGSKCRFNHPRDRTLVVMEGFISTEAGEFPERTGQTKCQHFMRTGTCRYGSTCKYHHPRQGGGGDCLTPISLNHMGYPLRPGEKECSYYMRTGQCKYGSTCRYHHPVPPDVQAPSQAGRAVYSPSQSVPSSQRYGASAPGFQSGPSPAGISIKEFPQRHGQPECQYFVRTGDCKFGSSCRYHHRMELTSPKAITLPLRPGAAQCSHFAQHGICKFGSACKFDHSMVSSSFTDMPVAPYPLGSTSLGTSSSSPSLSEQCKEVLSSSSIRPKTTTSSGGGSETLAVGDSSSSYEHVETNKGDSATSIEAKTSS
ncbi:unnamed protein product [Cochlearia groenlandica]